MSWEIVVVFGAIGAVILLSVRDTLPIDLVAILVMVTMLVTGILKPREALQGFSNPATITIAAMFVLSAGLLRSGALNVVGTWMSNVYKQSFWAGLAMMMLLIGFLSGFINNTAAVAIFAPVVMRAANDAGVSPSRLLIPLSFASMLGGVCTLLGTSTNILVSSMAQEKGIEPFGVFEFTLPGLALFAAGFLYLMFAVRWIPGRAKPQSLTEDFSMASFLTDVEVLEGAAVVGRGIKDADVFPGRDIEIMALFRGEDQIPVRENPTARVGDTLRIRGDVHELRAIQNDEGLRIIVREPLEDEDLVNDDHKLVQAVVAPNSVFAHRRLRETNILKNYSAIALALGAHGRVQHRDLLSARLSAGDALLLRLPEDRLSDLKGDPAFVVVSEVSLPNYRSERTIPALAIVVGVVLAAATGLVPIVTAAAGGAALMVLCRCLSMSDAYDAIEWRVIILLGAILSIATALETSGGAELIATGLSQAGQLAGPLGTVAILFGATFMLTNVVSNNATAALLAPIAIGLASSLDMDARPLLITITFAASLSFMTPIGYQTNTFIYGPGRYRFSDFLKIGTPLNLIIWVLAVILIPWFWPL